MKNLRINTVLLLLTLLMNFSGRAQMSWEFVQELTSGNKVEINAVKSDIANSCVYIGGVFSGDLSATFTTGLNGTPDFSTNNGGEDGFVAKYLEDGTFVWAFMVGGAGSDEVNDLDVDASGNIYITGSFETAGEFRGTEVTSYPNVTAFGGVDIFQAKYTPGGKFVWLHEDGGTAVDRGTQVRVLGSRVIFAGHYVVSGYTEIGGINPISYGGDDVFVLGRDLNGTTLWYGDGGSNADDNVGGLAVDGDSAYMATNFSGVSMTFIDNALNSTPAQTNSNAGFRDISYMSLGAASGLFGWVNQISGTDDELCYDLISNSTNLFMVGSYKGSILIPLMGAGPVNTSYQPYTLSLKNDLGTGVWFNVEATLAATDAVATCVDFDQTGNIFIGGEFNGTININGSFPIASAGGSDLFTVGYDPTGTYLVHNSASSGSDIGVRDISIDGTNELYFGGYALGNATYGSINTTIGGSSDGHFSKLGFCDASFSYTAASYCSGNPNETPTITGDPGGVFSEGSGNIVFVSTVTGEVDLSASTVGGPYTITYTAPGGCSQNFNLSIASNTNPTFTSCPANISTGNDAGNCTAVVNYTIPVATDDCGSVTVAQTDASGLTSGDAFPLGTTSLEYTATDLAGNTAICSFDITVTDTENPTITCPANISQGNDVGVCGASVTYSAPVGVDNCPGAVTTQTAGLASGATFPIGTTVNSYLVTDAAGNTSTCSFNVTVTDTESPSITCPADVVQNNDPGNCSAVVTFTAPTGTDNCPGATTVQSLGLPSGSTFPVGTTVNTFIVTDGAGNSSSCSFNVIVNDNESPTITCPSDITQNSDPGDCGAVVTYSVPTGNDNCSGFITTQIAGLPGGATFPVGTTVNTYQVTDGAGNSSSCSFNVTIMDNEPPSITCPADITQSNDPGMCSAVVTYTAPVGTDNCAGAVTTQTAGLASGSTFPVGTTTNTFLVTDANGSTATCSFNVTVVDSENPSITCPGTVIQNNDPGVCGATIVFGAPTGADNCPGAMISQISGLTSGSVFPVGSTLNSFQIMDAAGNIAGCSFTVTINDVELPVITCPADVTINNETDTCGAHFSFAAPVATDNCSISSTNQTAGPPDNSLFPVGVTTLGFEAVDVNGNTATCSYTVTVVDTTAPVIVCPSDTVSCDSLVSYSPPFSSDNCAVVVNQIDGSGYTSGSTFPVGITAQTYEVVDASGNTDQCSFNVEVLPVILPYWDTLPSSVCLAADTIDLNVLVTATPGVFSGMGVTGTNFVAADAGLGTHSITFTVSNAQCAYDSVQTITVVPIPLIDAGQDDSVCGVNYNLMGSSTVPGYWSSATCSFVDSTSPATTAMAPIFGIHELVWHITSPATCAATDTISIRFDEQEFAYAGPDQFIFEDLNTVLGATPATSGTGYWNLISGNGQIVDPSNPVSGFIASEYGIYELEWVVQNGSCPASSDDLILDLQQLIIPEGISPNADGFNDFFVISGIGNFSEKKLKIFDRWGKLVFLSSDYANDWGGINNDNQQVPDDTYFYELKLDEHLYTGFIVVKN